MSWIAQNLWLIPVLPLMAAGVTALTKQPYRRFASALAIGSMVGALFLSCIAFASTLGRPSSAPNFHEVYNFNWFQIGESSLRLGWVLDPLAAIMLVMVSFVGLLIFIYSVGYMAHDENFTRFFCFLSLFAAAMLGLLIANNLLLLFMCWELVGLASYLLIGFWYQKPSAAAAAKKAFITTRIGDVLFFLGILYLYSQSGTLLFYDHGQGCLENSVLRELVGRTTVGGMAVTTGIGLLIFCGAIGKSGQVPLHVWLPDAMEGPTPVSALIHAATMVAAGVFLIARVYPLLNPSAAGVMGSSAALTAVAWVGAITAVFAACIAVAQTDIKRILAYSTVSQLGFMMMGLGTGGVSVGIFHLITHAFFKALLFLGAGSVIHGCHEEQDIRRMGGLKRFMPITFATYAIGMMALSGVPIFFSGFWSKDAILSAAHDWPLSRGPYYLGIIGALLTAFYMTRQVCYVFFGSYRGATTCAKPAPFANHTAGDSEGHEHNLEPELVPHESPAVMTWPLIILSAFAIVLGFLGTPAWPWFQSFLLGDESKLDFRSLLNIEEGWILLVSSVVALTGIYIGWWLYGRKPMASLDEKDFLERVQPDIYTLLQNKFYVDDFYDYTIIRFNAWFAKFCDTVDYWVFNFAVVAVSFLVIGLAWLNKFVDDYVINLGFDEGSRDIRKAGGWISRLQDGQVQNYLRVIGIALVVLVLVLIWGCRSS
ncbi:NADH-quinone oxidoreductase subunit L [Pedosphaera parvula]|uniref:Proton-translocating NADH-quinone oxidoreductase, chain L n=1 Tax=Pedosphaera parvula (strain Ellin514) TaxID=320771 RepID=B9XFX3_PEDPL|nr:NADH-quinone oxidoreductase subunit L [Pedosphaera parvula]EEF61135.1 proton-translocating NADH-quinone oxidoreductase, chain L [Pedosphaera parvula Ellin514]